MLLEVLLARANELDGGELEPAVLEALNDGADKSTLYSILALHLLLKNPLING